jgi:hypothetical protein
MAPVDVVRALLRAPIPHGVDEHAFPAKAGAAIVIVSIHVLHG